jgi:uncharacterized protein (DUF2342 family)
MRDLKAAEREMSAGPAKELIARELQQAVERLQADIARVEFWADALGGFAQPIPEYDATDSRLNHYMLPARTSESGREMARGRDDK